MIKEKKFNLIVSDFCCWSSLSMTMAAWLVHRGFLKYICGGKNVCLNLGIFSSIYDLIISNQVYTTAHMYDFKVQSNLRQATI